MNKVLFPRSPLPLIIACALALLAGLAIQPSPTLVHASATDVPTGVALFHEKGCEFCHGVNGVGIPGKAPSLLTVGKRLKKDAIIKQIHDGGQGMPPFGDALKPEEINALADMLAKQKKAPKNLPPPATPKAQP